MTPDTVAERAPAALLSTSSMLDVKQSAATPCFNLNTCFGSNDRDYVGLRMSTVSGFPKLREFKPVLQAAF